MAFLNIVDLASRAHNGQIQAVTEVLAETNPIIKDIPMVECNDRSGYKSTIRTGLPDVSWRKLNYGVKQSKSETQQVRDACGMLEAYAKIDMDLEKLAKDKAAFLKTESDAFLEAMSQEWAKTLFYGDIKNAPEKFNGLAMRYAKKTGGTSAKNVIDAGDTGNNLTSVYLVGWGSDKVHGIYPEGSVAGVHMDDQGEDRISDGNNGEFQAHVVHYKLNTGLCVRDWRYVVRIANIDSTNIDAEALLKLMVKAKRLIPNLNACKPVFYAHRDVVTALEIAYMDKSNVVLSLKEAQDGLDELRASRIPIHECDAIKLDEAQVN